MFSLESKTALVTGAATGLGRAIIACVSAGNRMRTTAGFITMDEMGG